MAVRIGINGFGRIGRLFLRAALSSPDLQVLGLMDPAGAQTLAHLLNRQVAQALWCAGLIRWFAEIGADPTTDWALDEVRLRNVKPLDGWAC
jgi:Glyceraldehyde 3-phosphate dehydrogenase, NAD binding domain